MAKGIISGSGTNEEPYLIEDHEDFNALRSIPNTDGVYGTAEEPIYIELVNDIEFDTENPTNFETIGGTWYVVLDGKNKKLRNVYFVGNGEWALFETINGTVKDLHIKDLYVMTAGVISGLCINLFVSEESYNYNVLNNIRIDGYLASTGLNSAIYGISHYAYGRGRIEKCLINVEVGSNVYIFYGLCYLKGTTTGKALVINGCKCVSKVNVTNSFYGIAESYDGLDSQDNLLIYNCEVACDIYLSGTGNVYGIAGYAYVHSSYSRNRIMQVKSETDLPTVYGTCASNRYNSTFDLDVLDYLGVGIVARDADNGSSTEQLKSVDYLKAKGWCF